MVLPRVEVVICLKISIFALSQTPMTPPSKLSSMICERLGIDFNLQEIREKGIGIINK